MRPDQQAVFAEVEDGSSADLSHYVKAIGAHRWRVAAGFVVGVVLAVLYILVAAPLYEARTSLLVKVPSPPVNPAVQALAVFAGSGSAGSLGTQIELLQSNAVLSYATRLVACQQIVEASLGTHIQLLGPLPVGAPIQHRVEPGVVVPKEVEEALSPAVLRLCEELTPVEATIYLAGCAVPPQESEWPPDLGEIRTEVARILSIVEQDELRRKVEAHVPTVEEACLDRLESLHPKNLRDTDIIEIRAQSVSPDLVVDYANALAQEHIWYTALTSAADTARDLKSTERMLTKVEGQLTTKRSELFTMMSEAGVASISVALTSLISRSDRLDETCQTLEGTIGGARAALADLQNEIARQEDVSVSTQRISSPNPQALQLEEKLRSLEVERAALLSTVTEIHPEVETVDAQIAEIKRELEGQLEEAVTTETRDTNPMGLEFVKQLVQKKMQLTSDEIRLDALRGALQTARDKVAEFPQVERQIAGLQREVELLEKNYFGLMERQQALALAKISDGTTVVVVDRAVPPKGPIRPSKPFSLVAGALLGSVGALLLALLLDMLSNSTKTVEDLEQLLGSLPVVASVPKAPNGAGLVVAAPDGPGRMPEAYQELRTRLRQAYTDGDLESLVVTSAGPGEGTTTVAANLAAAWGAMGQRVILVEADMREPGLAAQLGLPSEAGLCGALLGEQSVEEVLQDTDVTNVQAIAAGPPPPNPLQLIESAKMTELLTDLKQRADLVVIDAPAISAGGDARTLAPMPDAVLLVVEAGKTRRPDIQRAAAMLRETARSFLGAVLNKAGGRG